MRFVLLSLLVCATWAADPKLPGGNVLSSETYSLRQLLLGGKLDVMDVPELYRKEGIKGISFNERYFKQRDDAYIDQLKAAVRKAGRVVVALQADGDLTLADPAKNKAQIEHALESLRITHRLGAPVMRVNTGGRGRPGTPELAAEFDRAVASFKQLIPLARQLKVKLGIENHGGIVGTSEGVLKLIQATDPKWVGAVLDFGNFHQTIIEDVTRLAPYAVGTHVKVGPLDERGEIADYDLPHVFRILKAAGYKYAVSIEYVGKLEPVDGVRKSRNLIVKHWPAKATT